VVRDKQQVRTCGHGSCFGYRWDAYECWLVLATGVTHVSLWPLVTMGNLGAPSCNDLV
jgi:cytochrome bd-type quinol oxidase subunit 2